MIIYCHFDMIGLDSKSLVVQIGPVSLGKELVSFGRIKRSSEDSLKSSNSEFQKFA